MTDLIERRTFSAALLLLCVSGCKGDRASSGAATGPIDIEGAGSSRARPVLEKWFARYQQQDPGVRVDYRTTERAGAVSALIARHVDFVVTDAALGAGELKRAQATLWHIPIALLPVAVAYNVPGVASGLKLTRELLADILARRITRWNDSRLSVLNSELGLPDAEIHAQGGSDYLAASSTPQQITGKPGAIGCIETPAATKAKLAIAAIRNAAGEFVQPSSEGARKAARGVDVPEDLVVSLQDSASAGAYPLSAFSYVVLYEDARDRQVGAELARLWWWAIHEGQAAAAELGYPTLPAKLVSRGEARLKGLRSGDKKLLSGG